MGDFCSFIVFFILDLLAQDVLKSYHRARMSSDGLEVFVLGDVAWQLALVPDSKEKDRFICFGDWIGAPLLEEMIRYAISKDTSGKLQPDVKLNPDYSQLNQNSELKMELMKDCQFIAVLAQYPRKSRSDNNDKVMRLSQDLRTKYEERPVDLSKPSFLKSLGDWTD
jgi:hypothetical protein